MLRTTLLVCIIVLVHLRSSASDVDNRTDQSVIGTEFTVDRGEVLPTRELPGNYEDVFSTTQSPVDYNNFTDETQATDSSFYTNDYELNSTFDYSNPNFPSEGPIASQCHTAEKVRVTHRKISTHYIELIWLPPMVSKNCNIKYDINMTKSIYDIKEIPYFRHASKSQHKFERLLECTSYNVSIKPSSGTLYQTTIRTLPEELENITFIEEDGKIKAQWNEPYSEECSRYNVTINDTPSYLTTNNFAELGETKDLRCTKLEIAAVDVTNVAGNFTTRSVPGEIRNLIATSDNHVISLTWEPPEDSSCVTDYIVKLDAKEAKTDGATSYNFTTLEACTAFTGEVAAISDTDVMGPASTFNVRTTTPSTPSEVTNLHLDVNETTLSATWGPPMYMGACITAYSIVTWDQNDVSKDYTTPYLYIEIEGVPCRKYTFQIMARIGSSAQGREIQDSASIAERPTEAPVVYTYKEGKISVEITVRVEAYSSNMCLITEVQVECNCTGEILEWTKEYSFTNLSYNDGGSSRPNAILLVTDLSEFTSYSCSIYVINSGGVSDAAILEFQTSEEVPSSPENLAWTLNETGGIISWGLPRKIPGVQGDYKVNIQYIQPLHYIPEDCTISKEDIEESTNADVTSYFFENPFGNTKYIAKVSASTTVGYGEPAELTFYTAQKSPEEPRSVLYDIINNPGYIYDVTICISWILPCNTNGNLTKFYFKMQGTSLEDDTNYTEDNYVPANEDITDLKYNVTFDNLRPLFNYSAEIYAIITDSEGNELVGEPKIITFLSPDGYPSVPLNVNVDNITSNSADIYWKNPENPNGELLNYRITINIGGPLHTVPEGCEYSTGTIEDVVQASETSYIFSGSPNFNYTITIEAETNAGFGPQTPPYIFHTSIAASEEVRNLDRFLVTTESEEYDVRLNVSFDKPCHLNDQFVNFVIEMIGSREGFPDHTVSLSLNYETNFAEISLEAERLYDGKVIVVTKEFRTNSRMEIISTPSGVPKISNETLSNVEVVDPHTAKFTLNRDTFDLSNGNIVYFAILLSAADTNTSEGFGFWSENEWPTDNIGVWSEDGDLELYQATPDKWNPFTGTEDRTFVFTIGTETCNGATYCNGKLRADTGYQLRVRGFTSRGYRDTVPTKFITLSDTDYGALIGGIVGGAAALIIIFIIIIIFWRRKNSKKEPVEKENVHVVYPIPTAVAIKKFAAHYDDLKANLNKLKAEYTLLESKSVEEQLSTSFALTDDNKRKNRYINILPYDATRVKLERDTNDNYTDYINASYVKGYSNDVEYIATQGPLDTTVVDFWRMVIQENVSAIVMVAQFVEQSKQKCFEYFPKNHETINIGDDIEIRCANELPLGGYVKRTLLVQRELMQLTVTHLQFTQWPDFGVPNNTETMLEFCNIMRQVIEQNKSKTVIHCSAGVGRTGTLIAVDILLQTIDNKGDIDVFKTVLNLRRQRVRMVQTEKQYMFIHNCLAHYICNPKTENIKQVEEPIYENVSTTRSDVDIAESAL